MGPITMIGTIVRTTLPVFMKIFMIALLSGNDCGVNFSVSILNIITDHTFPCFDFPCFLLRFFFFSPPESELESDSGPSDNDPLESCL